jgi:hypothetical protein
MANVTDMKEKCNKEENEINSLSGEIDNQTQFVKVL